MRRLHIDDFLHQGPTPRIILKNAWNQHQQQQQQGDNDNDNDNDNDTLREVPHLSMRAWPYRQERRGHGPTKKRSVLTVKLALLARCRNHSVMDRESCTEVNSMFTAEKNTKRAHLLLCRIIDKFRNPQIRSDTHKRTKTPGTGRREAGGNQEPGTRKEPEGSRKDPEQQSCLPRIPNFSSSGLGNFKKRKLERHQIDNNSVTEAAGNSSENNVVREEDSFQVDLRVNGVSQDAIYKDKERMTKMQTSVDKLQDRYRTKSIIKDLEIGISNTFIVAPRRTIKELGNIELYDLGEITKTVQCPSFLKYSKERTVCCLCGICLIPSLEHRKIKSRI